jgi:pimeloyl-ACP methyl ester carboxylesterase
MGSLPGYCWSTNPTKKGFNLGKIAEMFNKLMIALDYPSYVAQGGDWGSIVTRRLGQLHPEHCRAIHVNMLFTLGTPRLSQGPLIWLKWVTLIGPALLYDKREIPALKMFQKFRELETGYQVTPPATEVLSVGYSGHEATEFGLWIVGFASGVVSLDS